jgi:hypothetical protein
MAREREYDLVVVTADEGPRALSGLLGVVGAA